MDQRSAVLNRLTSSYTQEQILEVDLRSIEARRTIGRYHLDFVMRVDFVAPPPYADQPTLLWLWADVMVTRPGVSQHEVGRAFVPDPLTCFQPSDHPQPALSSRRQEARLRLSLDRQQLDAIEDVRGETEGLTFMFRPGGVAHNADQVDSLQPGTSGLSMDIAQSIWLGLLRQFDHSAALTFTLTIPPVEVGGVRGEATRALQQALEAYGRRAYDEAVADCRLGLTALTHNGEGYDIKSWSRDASKAERFWRVAKGLLSVSHAAHHPELADPSDDKPAEPIRFEREDAYAAIAMLAALIHQRPA